MSIIPVNLAVEDELSESALRRILEVVGGYAIGTVYGRRGFGYLKNTMEGWNRAAKGKPFVVLTDLDDGKCAAVLRDAWLSVPRHHNLMFRVAVRAIEAWLLADADGISDFLGVPRKLVPADCEALPHPKRALIELAQKSRSRDTRERLVPRSGSTAKQGPDYNACLSSFVAAQWQLLPAIAHSPSLRRAVERFRSFKPVWK